MGRRSYTPSSRRAEKLDNVLADIVIRSGRHPQSPIKVSESDPDVSRVKKEETEVDLKQITAPVVSSLLDFSLILTLVFGGCCSNVWAYEYLLKIDPRMGTALTFSQMAFITMTSIPSFVSLKWHTLPFHVIRHIPMPSLIPRQVPLSQWALQVLVLTAGSLLNNWAFAFHVPLTVQIVFRSAGKHAQTSFSLDLIEAQGLAVSMLFGRIFMKKRYSLSQIGSVFLVTLGVIFATTSRPMPSSAASDSEDHFAEYTTGVLMLTLSLFLTGLLGLLQEKAYTTYGPCWREGIFYTHALSLPIFSLFIPSIKTGFASLAQSATPAPAHMPTPASSFVPGEGVPPVSIMVLIQPLTPYLILGANLITQLICVSGVNQLTSRVSSVSTNLVLTTRKAISLLFSVWWFGNGWNAQLGWGAGMVFLGSIIYTIVTSRTSAPLQPSKPKPGSGRAASKTPRPRGVNGVRAEVWQKRGTIKEE
ncbi:hypothetical protein NM688_g731 [Phlebia brevispora]|uniref:Uncharacterized protein n=1 Tax=Phlebia brevispora TaxID=194682 RepID=A0ACC1TDI2_9APHY|nr:hypothetical protein NM688_g731 [Phlebia brevispora]